MTEFTDPATLSKSDLEAGEIFAPRFDANGLVTAITVETGTNTILMVAHMNAEAIAETLRSGHATYWSRSRGQLWKKGETSGELQEIVEIRTDCDQDALILEVRQTGHGAACHTGRKSCFYRRIVPAETGPRLEDTGMPVLFDPATVYKR